MCISKICFGRLREVFRGDMEVLVFIRESILEVSVIKIVKVLMEYKRSIDNFGIIYCMCFLYINNIYFCYIY